jgi:hypothetical protein
MLMDNQNLQKGAPPVWNMIPSLPTFRHISKRVSIELYSPPHQGQLPSTQHTNKDSWMTTVGTPGLRRSYPGRQWIPSSPCWTRVVFPAALSTRGLPHKKYLGGRAAESLARPNIFSTITGRISFVMVASEHSPDLP